MTGVKFSELLINGGVAAGIGIITTVAILYAIILWQRKRALKLTSTTSLSSIPHTMPSFSVVNPLKERQRQALPLHRPTKSLRKK